MKDVADHVRMKDGTDLYLFEAEDTFKALEPYLKHLVEFFKGASDQEIQAFRRIGSSLTAVRQQAYGMEAQIQKKHTDFKPSGLQEYLDSRDEAGTEEARTKILRIQKRIFDYVIGVLKKQYGTQDKAWWVKGAIGSSMPSARLPDPRPCSPIPPATPTGWPSPTTVSSH